jgi:hypothetical protein
MRPHSIPARLLATTPQGRRLFDLLAEQHAEISRLREMLRSSEEKLRRNEIGLNQLEGIDAKRRHEAESRHEAENALRWAQETEAATLRLELHQARSTAASMTDAVRILTEAVRNLSASLPELHGATAIATEKLDMLSANVAGAAARQDAGFHGLRMAQGKGSGNAVGLYLDLLEASLTGTLYADGSTAPWAPGALDPSRRAVGRDWPAQAQTMIGTARMRNLRHLLERALHEGVEGDFIETGVWRGGACIYARGILAAHGDATRRIFVADSFRGLPEADADAYPADRGDVHATFTELAIGRDQVAANFERFGLLDDRVLFLEGWFKDTLPQAPIERLAVLRLDGDMYESTIQALDALYHKVSPGGFVIIDDFLLPPCANAVADFRERHGITAALHDVDGAAVWWQVPLA